MPVAAELFRLIDAYAAQRAGAAVADLHGEIARVRELKASADQTRHQITQLLRALPTRRRDRSSA